MKGWEEWNEHIYIVALVFWMQIVVYELNEKRKSEVEREKESEIERESVENVSVFVIVDVWLY